MISTRHLCAAFLRKAARLVDQEKAMRQPPDDLYLQFLRFLVPGILEPGNIAAFDYALERLPSHSPILEIGALCGLSAATLTYLARRHEAPNQLICCDKWVFQRPAKDTTHVGPIPYHELECFARASYKRNMEMFCGSDLPFACEMFSDEFFEAWRNQYRVTDLFGRISALGGPLSFCFIDGNHTYEYAKRDFVNCDSFLEVGGFLLFDDSTLLKDDVRLVMPEVLATKRYELVMQNPYHLFRRIA